MPRPDARPIANARLMMTVASRLTDRDKQIIRLVARHRVFTTDQLAAIFFTSPTTARHRLAELHKLRVLDRFRPIRPHLRAGGLGSAPYHWVLDEAGAVLLSAENDEDLATFKWRRRRHGDEIALASSQQLDHLVAVNGFFTDLLRAQRAATATTTTPNASGKAAGVELAEWWNQAQAADWCNPGAGPYGYKRIRPDGYGLWCLDDQELYFFLELDRGTETHDQLRAKLTGYEQVETDRQVVTWVLVAFPTARREAKVRAALAGQVTVPVATAVLGPDQTPDGPVWLPLSSPGPRLPLIGLAAAPIPQQALERATSYARLVAEQQRLRAEQDRTHEAWLAEHDIHDPTGERHGNSVGGCC